MATAFKFGNGNWAVKEDYVLAYNDENDNFKPLPFDFTRATTATYVDSDGLIKTANSGFARIDYTDNTDGHLLLEPQRTNLFLNSNLFTNWSKEATVTLTANYGISPDGTQNSTRMQMNVNDSIFVSTTSGLTASVYVKGVQGETIRLSNGSSVTHTLTGQWDRIEVYDSGSVSTLITINTYSGATARDIELFGAQREAGSYATSYIPTEGASVTRNADRIEQSGFQGKVMNATQGTIFIHFNNPIEDGDNNDFHMFRSAGGSGIENGFLFRLNTGTGVDILERVSNSTGATFGNMVVKGQENKIAISFTSSTFLGSGNGVTKSYSGTYLGTKINIDEFETSSSALQGFDIIDMKFYNTALTQEEINALTQD